MKGQTQALTAVLITFVTVGAISAAYIWGTPLLEKREAQSQLETTEQNVLQLHNSIISVSNGGSGSAERVSLSISDGSLTINEEKDYIQIEVSSANPPYPAGTWTVLEGNSLQNTTVVGAGNYGIKNRDIPGIVAVEVPSAQSSLVRYRIDFRNMLTTQPSKIERIDLRTSGGSRTDGDTTLLITNDGVETESNVNIGSENLDKEKKVILVEIQ